MRTMEELGFVAFEEEIASIRIAEVQRKLEAADTQNEVLQEAYSDAVRAMFAMEDLGWTALGVVKNDGIGYDLPQARSVAEKLSEWCDTNPLLTRGREIRNSYLFSEPYEIGTEGAESKISPQQENVIAKSENQHAVFGLSALEAIEGQRYEAGNAFVLWDKDAKEFQQIPFTQIADIIYDPDKSSKILYVKRAWTSDIIDSFGNVNTKEFVFWYPGSQYIPSGGESFMTNIGGVEVDLRKRMIVSRANLKPGHVLGRPDAFAAAPWALAYSAYLRDGTKVLAALAEWVWKITPKKRPAAERAAAVVKSERGAGGSLFTDMDVSALPKADAVDLNTGRPLAAQVAASLGISIVVLLSDPGQSGAYGTAQTLADPNRRTMQARRELNTEFLLECLRLVGIKDPAITWSKMAPGTDLEETQLLAAAWGTGLFTPEEIRTRIADVAKINLLSETPPEGVLVPNNANSQPRKDIDTDGSTQSPDGTNSQANGVGRDNLHAGPISRTATDPNKVGVDN